VPRLFALLLFLVWDSHLSLSKTWERVKIGFWNGKTGSNAFHFHYGERWRDKQFGMAHAINPDVKHVLKLNKLSNGSSKCPFISFFRQQGKSFQDRLPIIPHLSDGAFINAVLLS
jgi:hypothetical protein